MNSGPKYLEGAFIEDLSAIKKEWKANIVGKTGNKRFKVKYFGSLKNGSIAISNDLLPQKVIAIDILTNEELLLFDGSEHGYNALFVDSYDKNELHGRKTDKIYTYKDQDIFELEITVSYGIDYESEDEDFKSYLDDEGMIDILNGDRFPFDTIKRNGFDNFELRGIVESGKSILIVTVELA